VRREEPIQQQSGVSAVLAATHLLTMLIHKTACEDFKRRAQIGFFLHSTQRAVMSAENISQNKHCCMLKRMYYVYDPSVYILWSIHGALLLRIDKLHSSIIFFRTVIDELDLRNLVQ